tara:strand:- start:37852 stop:38295 length:444 start_codon:yes stop_codon:yes gene_type:complete
MQNMPGEGQAGESTISKLQKVSLIAALGLGFFSFVLCCLLIIAVLKNSPGNALYSGPVTFVYWETEKDKIDGYTSWSFSPRGRSSTLNANVHATVYQHWVEIRPNSGEGSPRFVPREKIVDLQFSSLEAVSSQNGPKFNTVPKTHPD